LYSIRKAIGKSDGLAGIYCRITVDGTRAEMSISRKVPIDKWDAIVGKVRGVSAIAQEINELMRSIENAILDKQREFIKRGVSFTATDLRDAYLGKKQDFKKILDLFKEHNDKIYRLISTGEYALGTYKRYDILVNTIKISMDITECTAITETHQQKMNEPINTQERFESRFERLLKTAKVYPNWAVIAFIVSILFGLGLIVYVSQI